MVSIGCTGQITFTWDASEDATGYKIYYGSESRTYSSYVDVGNVTTYTMTIPVGSYFFAATAYASTSAGVLESDYSNEVSDTIRPNAPGTFRKVTE